MRQASIVTLLCTLVLTGFVRGQQAPSPPPQSSRQVTGVGSAVITARPEMLRVTIDLRGEGKDAKEALAKLDVEQKSSAEKLAKLGVPADAIKLADASLGEPAMNEQQRQMQMYVNMRGSSGRGGAKPVPTTRPVAASSTLTAEVALKASDHAALLTSASDLQEKIKAAFRKDAKATAATPEEKEVLEEMQMQSEMATGQPQPGEPAFLFVHKLTEAEQAGATADAFAAARVTASRLAKAAGAELGEAREITSTVSPVADGDADSAAQYQYLAAMSGRAVASDPASEATSTRAGMVKTRVTVTAVFRLK